MSTSAGQRWRARDPRVPICVELTTRPPLLDCWSLNLSASGMALVGSPAPGEEPPHKGSTLEVAFALPDGRTRIKASLIVRWAHAGAGQVGGRERIALGVSFGEMATADRAALALYLSTYRPHVLLALGTEEEVHQCTEAVGNEVELHRAATSAELSEHLGRGDIAAVVLLGDDGGAAAQAAQAVAAEYPRVQTVSDLAPVGDPSPRVVCAAGIDSHALVTLYEEHRVHYSLARPYSPTALWLAIQRACQEYAVQGDVQRAMLEYEREHQREKAPQILGPLPTGVIAESEEMSQVIQLARTAAPHDVSVLLLGETGTGKEVLARAIHEWSPRAASPFVAVDAGALTETLLESELFGHMRGAFTGAVHDHPGLLQVASGGTVFLDEIQNMTHALQAKLLRAIETGEVRPVGGTRPKRVDIRIVAASNVDLSKQVEGGRFRADLFYRLHRFPIPIPPLRARRKDILPLAREFLRLGAPAQNALEKRLDESAEELLLTYDWPGNVRELRSVIERAILLSGARGKLGPDLLPPELKAKASGRPAPAGSLEERMAQFEREIIRAALERNGGVLRRAAIELGVHPVTFARRVRRHRLPTA